MTKKLALVGGGSLSGIVAKACADGWLEGYELVGVWSRTYASAQKTAALGGCRACRELDELLALKPDYVAEAASVEAVREIAIPVLSGGADLIALSCGAFADEAFLAQVRDCAAAHGTRVHIPSGAIGGFDVLQTISLMGQAAGVEEVSGVHARKSPAALKNTSLYREELEGAETDVFDGSSLDAIALLPTKVNVTVAAALATTGPGNTRVRITTTPGFVGDDHTITAGIGGMRATLNIFSDDSSIAGWSIVALLRNLASPIAFY